MDESQACELTQDEIDQLALALFGPEDEPLQEDAC